MAQNFTKDYVGVITEGVVQTVHTHEGTMASGTSLIPNDNTIPQNTEGTEFLTASITPFDTANKLKIEVTFVGSINSNSRLLTVALFQDSTANALAAAAADVQVANYTETITFTYWMTAGTTSSTTFKVRAGADATATTYRNGNGVSQKYGGVAASTITITEYKV